MNTTNPSSLRYCVQCRDKTSGKVADFVYDVSAPYVAVSPLFDGLQYLYQFLHARGLESSGFDVRTITLPRGTRLVAPTEPVAARDHILWSRNPQDAWTRIDCGSPFVGQAPEQIGCCIVRDL